MPLAVAGLVRVIVPAALLNEGIPEATVRGVLNKIVSSEYKRRQAAPGLKVTGKAFGLGRRMPLAQRFVD